MDNEEVEPQTGITRRDALRRGALLGGALTWSVPVGQLVGMRPALAQAPSPACESTTCATVIVGGEERILRCTPSTPEDHACFCCCAFDVLCADCSQIDP